MPAGRPTKYKPEYAKQAAEACHNGATDADLAELFDVSTVTIWSWKSAFPEFLNALKVDKEHADNRVERSLYERAIGYTYDAVKILSTPQGVVEVPYKHHVPPDPVSCFFWLKNRRKETWRDNAVANIQENRTFTITIGNARIEPETKLIEVRATAALCETVESDI